MEDRGLILMDHPQQVPSAQRSSLASTTHMSLLGAFTYQVIVNKGRVRATPPFNCYIVGLNLEEANVDGLSSIHFDERVDEVQTSDLQAVGDPAVSQEE